MLSTSWSWRASAIFRWSTRTSVRSRSSRCAISSSTWGPFIAATCSPSRPIHACRASRSATAPEGNPTTRKGVVREAASHGSWIMNMQTTNTGATRALVRAVRDIRWEEIPRDACEVTRQCLLDFLGCAIAGSRQPLAQILLTEIAAREGSSEATLVGRQERCSRLTAALLNGAAGHALDFDDTHLAMGGHPSVPVIPSVLALAETIAANGRS